MTRRHDTEVTDWATFQAHLERLRAQGDTMSNAWDRGHLARLENRDANPWFDDQGRLIHCAATDWRSGWLQANYELRTQGDLFAVPGMWASDWPRNVWPMPEDEANA